MKPSPFFKTALSISIALAMFLTPNSFARDLIEKSAYEKEIKFSNNSQERILEVDNIFGKVDIQGYSGKTVRIQVKEILRADDQKAMQEAINDTRLDITERNNTVLLFAEAPYRYNQNYRYRKYYYTAQYDITIQVPYETDLKISTINNGHININNIKGFIKAANVNGSLFADGITGACDVQTVNGRLEVNFDDIPLENCAFQTVNGDIRLGFPSQPHGDYRMKTFNGELYSDFDYSALPSRKAVHKSNGRLTKITTDGFVGVRIGAGGPEHEAETLNGDVVIRKN